MMTGSEGDLTFDNTDDRTTLISSNDDDDDSMFQFDQNNNDGDVSTLSSEKIGLKRQVSLLSSISLYIGMIIGSGIFASPRNVAMYAGSTGSILLVWVGCGIISLFASLTWCELGTMFPNSSGAEYAYLIEAFGPLCGFMYLYMMIVALHPCGLAMVAIVCGDYVSHAFGLTDNVLYSKLIAAGVILIVSCVNATSVIWATRFQNVFTASKLIGLGTLIVTGFVQLGKGHLDNFVNAFNGSVTDVSKLSYAFYGGLWSYNGWNSVNFIAAESTNPGRDIPLTIFIGMPIIILCYVLVNVAYLTVLTPSEIASNSAVAATVAQQLYGKFSWIMPVFAAASTIGAINGSVLVAGRMVFEGAKRGHIPRFFSMLHMKRRTPVPAILLVSVLSLFILIPKSSTFVTLTGYFSFSIWMFYSMTTVGLLALRYQRPHAKRPFKVFVGIPILIFLCSLYFIVAPFYYNPLGSFYCLIFILTSIPVYFGFIKYRVLPLSVLFFFGKISRRIQHFFNLSTPDLDVDNEKECELGVLETFEIDEEEQVT